MANRICNVVVLNHRLDPVATELHVLVEIERLTTTTELKGKLTGPRCAYASTIEVAYPMQEIERIGQAFLSADGVGIRVQCQPHIALRALIPEPSWWEPETPFLYEVRLELWQDGELCERNRSHHGVRSLQMTSTGLKLNGRPFIMRGKSVKPTATEADLNALREEGIDGVMTSFSPRVLVPDLRLWHAADRCGLFVLYRALDDFDPLLRMRGASASVFGSVRMWGSNDEPRIQRMMAGQDQWNRPLIGVEWTGLLMPASAEFLMCREAQLPSLSEAALPKIVLMDRLPEALPYRPDVIGWIESS